MTSDQQRTVDALALFHGGWAQTAADDDLPPGVLRVRTAGDQPNYLVQPDGSAEVHLPWDHAGTLTAEQVQLAVYGQEV